jgi:hypothetical protein
MIPLTVAIAIAGAVVGRYEALIALPLSAYGLFQLYLSGKPETRKRITEEATTSGISRWRSSR